MHCVLSNGDTDQSETLLVPSVVPLLTQSAPGSGGESATELSDIETIKEAEDDKADSHETFKRCPWSIPGTVEGHQGYKEQAFDEN